jgi:site-specific recombinase XerD
VAWLAQRGVTRIRQMSLQHLESYQAEMGRRDYKASTRERKTCAIKTFFKFLHFWDKERPRNQLAGENNVEKQVMLETWTKNGY